MQFFLTLLIFLTTISAQAALYKYTDENGEVVYSEEPPYAGAKEFIPPQLQITPAIKIKPKAKPKLDESVEDESTKYTSFQITSPKNGATFQNNAGNIGIALGINPELDVKAGHYINIFLDDVAIIKNSTNLSAALKHINRGTHNIKAELRDKSGKLILFSNNVIIYVHRHSKLHKKNRS